MSEESGSRKAGMRKKKLREGYTTGTCAAGSAAAALTIKLNKNPGKEIQVELPGGKEVKLPIQHSGNSGDASFAEIKKDAGDDPDVTHGAVIGCKIRLTNKRGQIEIKRGSGVGVITRPGLAVEIGKPAINPVPRKMIINEIRRRIPRNFNFGIEATFYIQNGEKIAIRTLNPKLGIKEGLSILGTTGIVKPFSAEAYKETIDICLRGAKILGIEEIVLTTGGKSEKLMRNIFPTKNAMAFVQFADFLHYATTQAVKMGFYSLQYGCFFGKLCKWAMGYKYTHAHKTLQDMKKLAGIARKNGLMEEFSIFVSRANTAREILDSRYKEKEIFFNIMGSMALQTIELFAGSSAGINIKIHLFDFNERLLGTWGNGVRKDQE